MSRILYESDYAILTIDESLNLIHLSWIKPVTMDIYKKVFIEGIDAVAGLSVQNMISDIRKEGPIPIEAVRWLKSEIISKLNKLGVTRLGIIINNEIFSQLYINALQTAITKQNVTFSFFNDYESALVWVKS